MYHEADVHEEEGRQKLICEHFTLISVIAQGPSGGLEYKRQDE